MKKLLVSSLGLVTLSPMLAFAQVTTQIPSTGLGKWMTFFSGVVAWGIPLLSSVAILYFIWEVIQYTIAGDEEAKKKSKTNIIYAVVGIAVIFSIWGLVTVLQNTFTTEGGTAQKVELPSNLH